MIITSTSGKEFDLQSRRMREVDANPYVVSRAALRKAIKGATVIRYNIVFQYSSPYHQIRAGVVHRRFSISLGCQTFSGKNFLRLRAWALKRSK